MTTQQMMNILSRKSDMLPRLGFGLFWLALFVAVLGTGRTAQAAPYCDASNTITANVVVLDNPTVFNRLGAQNPNWITYALKRDVIAVDSVTRLPTGDVAGTNLTAGNVELRPDKRPRPLVVRSIAGNPDRLRIVGATSTSRTCESTTRPPGTPGPFIRRGTFWVAS